MFVFGCTPETLFLTSCPTSASASVENTISLEPLLHCEVSFAKYLLSEPLTDWTASAKFWSPLKNVKEFAAPPDASLSVSITPDTIWFADNVLEDRDTQLRELEDDVLTTLVMSMSTAGISLLSIKSLSANLILLTISP